MNKLYTLALLLLGFAGYSHAQLNCGDTYTDSGGNADVYGNDENDTVTVCPGAGQVVIADFTFFDTEDGYDSLTIYNGNSVMDMMIGSYMGTNSPGTVYSTNPNGCLTFVWASDISVTYDGWEAAITCADPITCFTPTALMSPSSTDNSAMVGWTSSGAETSWMVEYGPEGFTQGSGTQVVANSNPFNITGLNAATMYDFYVSAICSATDTSFIAGPASFATQLAPFICGNDFIDNGGAGTYNNDSGDTITICPGAGQVVLLDFSMFYTEEGYDSLTIYNGSSTADMMIGSYQGELPPFQVYSTSADGCLTAVFHSDGSVTEAGWVAAIDCIAPITCFEPTNLMVDTTEMTTATLSWTAGGAETQWIVEYGPAGFTEGTGTEVTATTNPFTLTGLMGSMGYDFYVRSYCGGTDTSYSAGPQGFSTQLAPFVCGNLFVDPGVGGDYDVMIDDTTVICPTGDYDFVQVDFTSFSTEDGYDSLMIFNGNGLLGTLIGTYMGTNSPGTVTSTAPDGCLTFVFHSDEIIPDAGWSALIDCQFYLAIDENAQDMVTVYPNPSTGKFTIENKTGNAMEYSVLDMQGRKLNVTVNNNTVDLSNHQDGIYFLVATDGASTKTYSLVKN